ncbi:MAG: GldG family protein, partial [Planctomycetota bacterium]
MHPKLLPALSLFVGLALFVSVNLFAGVALRFWRVDLTQQDLFTLSEGTDNILSELDGPITMRLFFSAQTAAGIPSVETYARRVRELLEEFEKAADGLLVLQVIDPEPYSEAEELALSYGIRGQLINAGGDMLYLGLAATNDIDELKTIPSFDPRGEAQLEYDLIKIVHDLGSASRPHVSILSSLPLEGAPAMFPGAPSSPGWRIFEVLQASFEVESLVAADLGSADGAQIPEETDVLLIFHPKDLSSAARFVIDQYALGGGNVLALVDPYCYFDV